MKDSVNNMHVLVCLTCVVVLHLSGLHKHQKNLCSGGFLQIPQLGQIGSDSADTDSHTEARHVVRPRYLEGVYIGLNRQPWAWLACVFSSHWGTAENFSWFSADMGWGWGLATPARLCHCCCYPDTTELDCWCIHEVFVSGWAAIADQWTELLISWQCRQDLLQRTFSKQVHFPCNLIASLLHYLWWVVG